MNCLLTSFVERLSRNQCSCQAFAIAGKSPLYSTMNGTVTITDRKAQGLLSGRLSFYDFISHPVYTEFGCVLTVDTSKTIFTNPSPNHQGNVPVVTIFITPTQFTTLIISYSTAFPPSSTTHLPLPTQTALSIHFKLGSLVSNLGPVNHVSWSPNRVVFASSAKLSTLAIASSPFMTPVYRTEMYCPVEVRAWVRTSTCEMLVEGSSWLR